MLKKLQKLGNWPLIITLGFVILLAVVLVIFKSVTAKDASADTNIGENVKEELPKEEDKIYVQENYDDQEEPNDDTTETPVDIKYFIRINYGQNVVTIYEKDTNGQYTNAVKAMVCSTGTATPTSGTYTISDKYTWGVLNGGVCGQYCSRIVKSILFHSVPYQKYGDKSSLEYWEYDKLGTKASAGCIRLTVQDAKWIFDNCKAGTQVEFYTDSNPGPLGKPEAQKISGDTAVRGWDPTDPDTRNPWKIYNPPEQTPTTPSTPTTPVNPDKGASGNQGGNQGGSQGGQNTGKNEGTGGQTGGNQGEQNPGQNEGAGGEQVGGNQGGQTPGQNEGTGGQTGGNQGEQNPGQNEGTGGEQAGENQDEQTPKPDEGNTGDTGDQGDDQGKGPGETEEPEEPEEQGEGGVDEKQPSPEENDDKNIANRLPLMTL